MNAIFLRIVVALLQIIGLCIAIPIMIGFLIYDALFNRRATASRT